MTRRATGADDPALAETTWPLPSQEMSEANHRLLWGSQLDDADMRLMSACVSAYRALVCDGTTIGQQRRLAALRRVYRRRP